MLREVDISRVLQDQTFRPYPKDQVEETIVSILRLMRLPTKMKFKHFPSGFDALRYVARQAYRDHAKAEYHVANMKSRWGTGALCDQHPMQFNDPYFRAVLNAEVAKRAREPLSARIQRWLVTSKEKARMLTLIVLNDAAIKPHNWLQTLVRSDFAETLPLFNDLNANPQMMSGLRLAFYFLTQYLMAFYMSDTEIVPIQRPTIHRNARGQLQNMDGPAIDFHDGVKRFFFFNGAPVPAFYVLYRKRLKPADLFSVTNVTLRRWLIDHYKEDQEPSGAKAFMLDTKRTRAVQSDETGILMEVPFRDGSDFPMRFVQVVNGSPEPDGTYAVYYLRVRHDTLTARQGVASTYGMHTMAYHNVYRT